MKAPLTYANKFRPLALAMISPLVLLAACGGGGTSGSSSGSPAPGAGLAAPMSKTTVSTIASTVPANGDVNPYGVAIVQQTVGNLKQGNVLVSNFNNFNNLQGTGSTIVQVAPTGSVELFSHIGKVPGSCPGGGGLTTALVARRSGWVIVGSLPTVDGTAATAQAGCLIVLDSTGKPVDTISGAPINGPWDMTSVEDGSGGATLFVTNVLNGTVAANGSTVNGGTVVRIDLQVANQAKPKVAAIATIGSGFPERTDPAALVIGPTGLGLSPQGTALYVADSLENRIAVISNPLGRTTSDGTGATLVTGDSLNDPLGLAVDGAGNIFTANGNDGFLLVFDPDGMRIDKTLLDKTVSRGSPPGAGALFGLAVASSGGVYFVDDATNTLNFVH